MIGYDLNNFLDFLGIQLDPKGEFSKIPKNLRMAWLVGVIDPCSFVLVWHYGMARRETVKI